MESELKKLWRLVFGDEEAFIDTFFERAYDPRRCRFLTEEGRVIAMAFWLDCAYRGQKMAYLYAVATHPEFRGRGLCTRLMGDIHKSLKEEGYWAAILRPAEAGLGKMYTGMGYESCCTVSEFSCKAGDKLEISRISAEEYGKRRRRFLPPEGVIQEGENLRFLSGLAEFYEGPGFLLAASREGERLNGIELLGDKTAAPGIVAALGCKSGRFRTSGGEGSFAMIRKLREDACVPGYLGLVFD